MNCISRKIYFAVGFRVWCFRFATFEFYLKTIIIRILGKFSKQLDRSELVPKIWISKSWSSLSELPFTRSKNRIFHNLSIGKQEKIKAASRFDSNFGAVLFSNKTHEECRDIIYEMILDQPQDQIVA